MGRASATLFPRRASATLFPHPCRGRVWEGVETKHEYNQNFYIYSREALIDSTPLSWCAQRGHSATIFPHPCRGRASATLFPPPCRGRASATLFPPPCRGLASVALFPPPCKGRASATLFPPPCRGKVREGVETNHEHNQNFYLPIPIAPSFAGGYSLCRIYLTCCGCGA
jgi:hypothetical protein